MATPLFPAESTKRIEAEIDQYFEASIERAAEVGSSYEQLWRTMHNLIKAGGKRLRPNMTLLAYELFGGTNSDQILPIATAQELLHFSLLIHDDIIDRDTVRYGRPNVTGHYQTIYGTHVSDANDSTHFAQSAAIIGGDLMLAAAHELIASSDATPNAKAAALRMLSDSIFDAGAGELLDIETSFMPYTPGDALNVALLKTARYSFVAPLLCGATLAGASPKQCAALRDYGEALGVAYQLRDDIDGTFGDERRTGKSTVSDIREGKRTLMVEYAVESMSKQDMLVFERIFGNANAAPDEYETIKRLLESTGAKQKVEAAINAYAQKARGAISRVGLGAEEKAKLMALVDTIVVA